MAEKIYVGKARYITFRDGGEKCRIWLTPEGVENINRNVDNNGSINLVMVEMRDPDRAGNTHTLYIDDWKPDGGHRRNHAPGSRPERSRQGQRPERPVYQERQERGQEAPTRGGNSQTRDDGGFNAYNGQEHRYSQADCYPNGQTPPPVQDQTPPPVQEQGQYPSDYPEEDLPYDDIPF